MIRPAPVRRPPSYSRNRADEAALLAHLQAADAQFLPSLSSRVDLSDYAAKLHRWAERFEAWDGSELVGLVATYCNSPASAFVSSVSVLPSWQGCGVARELMHQCLLHVRQSGLTSVSLHVSPQAGAAVSLYRALGFAEESRDDSRLELRLDFQPKETPSIP